MSFKYLYYKRGLALALIASQMMLSISIPAYDQDLKEADVYKVMQQIFQQHVDKKEISVSILKSGFEEYINDFDPYRLYLLESEVRPYLLPTESEINQFIEQYKNSNLASFEELNRVIRKSIERSRTIRNEIMQSTDISKKLTSVIVNKPGLSLAFAKDRDVLKARITNDIAEFFQNEIRNNGKERVLADKAAVFARYNAEMMRAEAPYMGTDASGQPLNPEKANSIFAMLILKALTSSLDAHSKFLDNQEAFDLRVHLEKKYLGIGIEVKKQGTDLFVNRLIENGPAAKSGQVKVHDKILSVDGHNVTGQPLDTVLGWLRDNSNPIVELVLLRSTTENGQVFDKKIIVDLTQAEIAINEGRVETSYQTFDDGIIGRIVLHSFYRNDAGISSEKDLKAGIQKLKETGNLKGLILDLRDNTGGFLGEAVKIAGLFITSGAIVVSKYSNGNQQVYRDVDAKAFYTGPLVILTSRETASAAEIVSQALQDYGVALVVGDEHTYGKGTIQSQTVTDQNSNNKLNFKVTVGEYFTVSGKTPQGLGVKADVIVPSPLSEMRIGEAYLEHVEPSGTIAPLYDDDLKDIDPSKKDWYVHYYKPKLQHKVAKWRAMLPELQQQSADRMAHNKPYQKSLLLLKSAPQNVLPSFNSDMGDLQLQEAYHIVEDMIKQDNQSKN